MEAAKMTSAYGKIGTLLRELSDDEDEDNAPSTSSQYGDPRSPWLEDFHGYLNSKDHLTTGMSIVQWWGINAARYPVWGSLARDYLVACCEAVDFLAHNDGASRCGTSTMRS
ncbi:hypothetical protein BJ138DRAFT_1119412 [Hygrophoropsis aurantiaca]|uniref:Uncharacterized protein n=1 Tax=Hygrophoropsis aurantiaca TaxID=72124 RepID=A0ACB7ZUA7_9AGAM|nr:hypothetical protein BJ138DRAFT_1119412 [Hygrophoropsis aurantiaca]